MARLRSDGTVDPNDTQQGPPSQFGGMGGAFGAPPPGPPPPGGGPPPAAPGAEPPAPPSTPPTSTPTGTGQVQSTESPRERQVGGSSSLRIPPPAAAPQQLGGGGLEEIGNLLGGGAATPTRPRSPEPMTANGGHATFFGSLDPAQAGLFGGAGGLLGGGLGTPHAADPTHPDISALIAALLKQSY